MRSNDRYHRIRLRDLFMLFIAICTVWGAYWLFRAVGLGLLSLLRWGCGFLGDGWLAVIVYVVSLFSGAIVWGLLFFGALYVVTEFLCRLDK